MRTHRVWVEIAMLGTTIACVLAIFLASLGAAAGAVGEVLAPEQTVQAAVGIVHDGVITCSRCGARHSAAIGKTAADCVRTCVREDATFILVDGDETYLLEGDLVVLKQFAGRRAQVMGAISGRTIKVSTVAVAGGME